MSSFIMSPETVAYIAEYIAAHINNGFNYTHLYNGLPQEFVNRVMIDGMGSPELIYKQLYALNYDAFEGRYEGRHAEDLESCREFANEFSVFDNRIDKPSTGKAEKWHYQMLKSMRCYLYQCNEGEVFVQTDTYKAVENMVKGLTDYIINKLPEYQEAEWK